MIDVYSTIIYDGITLAIIIITASNIQYLPDRGLPSRIFVLAAVFIGLGAALGIIGAIEEGNIFPGAVYISSFISSVMTIISVLIPYLFVVFSELSISVDKKGLKKKFILLSVPVFIIAIFLILNLNNHLIFEYTAENIYQNGKFALIAFIPDVFYLIYGIVIIMRSKKTTPIFADFSPVAFVLPFAAAIIIRLFVYEINLTWMSLAIGLVVLANSINAKRSDHGRI